MFLRKYKNRTQAHVSLFLAFWLTVLPCCQAFADDFVLPASLITIEESAFEGDTALDEVILPEGIESIGPRAFAETLITHINLPGSLSHIADSSFDNTPRAAFHAEPGTYAYQWLADHHALLYFGDAHAYEANVEMAVFEENEDIGLFSDPFVYYFSLAETENWSQRLSGEPVWSVTQTSGPATEFWIEGGSPYERSLCVSMPEEPLTATYEIRCEWDGQTVTAYPTVQYMYPNVVPSSVNIPDIIYLTPGEENIFELSFEPSFFRFGEPRVGLERYNGEEEHWFEGNILHIIPYGEGTFTGNIYLYAGNMYIGKSVVFRSGSTGDTFDPAVEASGTDWYTLTWYPVEGVPSYTVSAYLDEACTQLFFSHETEESYIYFNTDINTRYWFVVNYETNGETICSQPITADPVTPLPAPENLTATVLADGTVQLSWDPVGDVWGYRIYFSSSPMWTLDTEWFSYEGVPENSDLWLDKGETIYVWVCADNYDGPNERTSVAVHRDESITEEELYALPQDETFDLHISDSALDNLTAEEVDPVQEEAFWDQVAVLREAIANYNSALDAIVNYMDEEYSDIDVSLDGDTLVYTSPQTTFTVSGEVLNLISGGYKTGNWISDGSSAQLEVFVNGQTCYLKQNAQGLSFVSSDGLTGRSTSSDSLDAVMTQCDAMEERSNEMRRIFDDLSTAIDGFDLACSGMEEYFGISIGEYDAALSTLADIKNLLYLPEQHSAFSNAHKMLLRLNEIAAHTHPTAMEQMSSYSMDIISIMMSKLNAARWALVSEMLNNWYGMYLGLESVVKNLASNVQKWKDNIPVAKTLDKLLSFTAGKLLTCRWMRDNYEKAHELYDDVLRLDAELHFAVQGVVESQQGNRLEGVLVAMDFTEGVEDDIRTTTDGQGYYFIEVPHEPAILYYFKDGYFPEQEEVSITPYQTARRDVTMEKRVWGTVSGTVRDEFGDPVANALIHAGEYSSMNCRWEYQAYSQKDGSYTLSLPVEEHNFEVTVTKGGYRNAFETLRVPENDSYLWDPVLPWMYGVKGEVKSDVGVVANAHVSFYPSGSSRPTCSCNTDENGKYRYMLPPGVYTMEINAGNYISNDLVHGTYIVEGFTVHEDCVSKINAEMISTLDKYKCNILFNVIAGNDVSVHYISSKVSWGNYTAEDEADPVHPLPGCICVSDVKDVTLHITLTYEVDGITYMKEDTKHVDLTSCPSWWTHLTLSLGWWNEP